MGELSCHQIDHREEVVMGSEPPRSGNCCLYLGVDRFSSAVAHLVFVAIDDSVYVIPDGGPQSLEGGESGSSCPTDPLLQGFDWVNTSPCLLQDLPQSLLHSPGTSGLEARSLQPVHDLNLVLIPAAGILEGTPADPLKIALLFDLRSSHLFQCLIGQLDQMEGVKAWVGLLEMFSTASLVTLGKIHGDRFDLFRIPLMCLQILDEGGKDTLVFSLGSKQGAALVSIMEDRDVAQSPNMFLIDTDTMSTLMALLLSGTIDDSIQRLPEAVIRHPQKVSDLSYRKVFSQGDGKGLKQQREAATSIRPGDFHLSGLAAATGHTGECSVDEGLVLKEVEMLPSTGLPVMDRLINFPTDRTRKTFLTANYIKVNLSLIGIEPNIIDFPRSSKPKGSSKQVCRIHHGQFSPWSMVLNSPVQYHDFPH